jgi:acetyl esterase/lipase
MHKFGILFLCAAAALPAASVEQIAGAPLKGRLVEPFSAGFDPVGNLYICEYRGQKITRQDRDGVEQRFAGTGVKGFSGDGGPAASAQLNDPHSIATAKSGMYIADTMNHRIRKVDWATGVITTIAGNGTLGFSGDGGPALQAQFHGVYSIAVNNSETAVYVADLENRRIRRVDLKTGIVTTVAGNGVKGVPADGAAAKDSPLFDPRAVAVDGQENVYILERGGNALRAAGRDGKIRTLIGPATVTPPMKGPKDLCVDRDGTIVIADAENNLVRRFDPKSGIFTTILGTGLKGSKLVPSEPLATEVFRPHGVRLDPGGDLIVADSYNHRVLRLRPHTPAGVKAEIEYGKAAGVSLRMDTWAPEGPGPFPAVVLVHGGGWSAGDKEYNLKFFFEPLSKAGFAWFTVDYRLAPQHPYPAAIDDVVKAVRFIQAHAREYRVDPKRIAISGESAGGHIAAYVGARYGKQLSLAAVVPFYPATDFVALTVGVDKTPNIIRSISQFAGVSDTGPDALKKLRDASPATWVKKGIPPFLFIHGTKDVTLPYHQSELMCDLIRKSGGACELLLVEGAPHWIGNWERNPEWRGYKQKAPGWLHNVMR